MAGITRRLPPKTVPSQLVHWISCMARHIIMVCPCHVCPWPTVLLYILTTQVLQIGFLVLEQSFFTSTIKQYRWFARSDRFLNITLFAISFRTTIKTRISFQFPPSTSQYKLNPLWERVRFPINGSYIYTIDASKLRAISIAKIRPTSWQQGLSKGLG